MGFPSMREHRGQGGSVSFADEARDRIDALIASNLAVERAVQDLIDQAEYVRVEKAFQGSAGGGVQTFEVGSPLSGGLWDFKRLTMAFSAAPASDVTFWLDNPSDPRALLEVAKQANITNLTYAEAIPEGMFVADGRVLFVQVNLPANGTLALALAGKYERTGQVSRDVREPTARPAQVP